MISVKSLGCWGESDSDRAISGDYGTLDKEGCYDMANSLGYSVFAINNGSKCYTSPTAWSTYKKYGPMDSQCNGSLSNEVYQIQRGRLILRNCYQRYYLLLNKYFICLFLWLILVSSDEDSHYDEHFGAKTNTGKGELNRYIISHSHNSLRHVLSNFQC